jgi:hypothetical protein
VNTIEELLVRKKNSSSDLENRKFYPQKLALTSPTSGGCLIGIVRLRTQAMEFGFSFFYISRWLKLEAKDASSVASYAKIKVV